MSPLNRYMTPFCAKKQIPPTAPQKILDKYSDTIINWKKVYSSPFCTTLDSKLREFQYKILNNIVFTNDKLFRFGLSQSPNCTFCNEEPESLEHLLSVQSVFGNLERSLVLA